MAVERLHRRAHGFRNLDCSRCPGIRQQHSEFFPSITRGGIRRTGSPICEGLLFDAKLALGCHPKHLGDRPNLADDSVRSTA
jgi:hypothetical protein